MFSSQCLRPAVPESEDREDRGSDQLWVASEQGWESNEGRPGWWGTC
jgi:hypothetical protein